MNRNVQPEWLDQMQADDPHALNSRRDLQKVNAWMGNVGIIERAMREAFDPEPPRRIADLGGGDGLFALRLAERLARRWKKVEVLIVDKQKLMTVETIHAFQRLDWRAEAVGADAFAWCSEGQPTDCLIANLFLHHFEKEHLEKLFRATAKQTMLFVGSEPRRSRFALLASR